MKMPKTLLPVVFSLSKTNVASETSLSFPVKKLLCIRPGLKIFMMVFFAVTMLSAHQLFAQDTPLSSEWESPDILKVKAGQRMAARGAEQALAVAPIANPDIPQSLLCRDLNVVFVLDESGSIAGSEITSVRNGAMALANALLNSGASLRLVEFNTTSSIINLGVTVVNSTFITRLNSYLTSSYNSQSYAPQSSGSCVGWTNWEAALKDVSTLNADLVIFFTDGNPTAYNVVSGGNCASGTVKTGVTDATALDPAITQANLLKSQGKHMFLVGVGNANELNLNNIKAISGADAFGPSHDILTADYTTPPFEQLATNLSAAVNAICGTVLTIDKTSSQSGVCAGQPVIFTNTVTNTGGSFNFTALSVVAKDVYPNGYSNLQIIPPVPAGLSISGNTITYTIGDMTAGQIATYQVKATVNAPPGNYNNVVSATAFNANEVRDSVSVLSGYATHEIDTTACAPVVINGSTYSLTGTYTQTLKSAAGCDSILTLKVIINHPSSHTEILSACNTYTWHDQVFTESNTTATWTGVNAAGCDSVVTLNLTINKTVRSTEPVIACNSYTWHGQSFTESNNTATWTGVSAAGCDSIVTLDLTINKTVTSTDAIIACNSYTWHGQLFTESNNTATWTGVSVAGCDSIVTLNLTINKTVTSTDPIIACNSYTWHDQSFTESNTTATWTGVSVAGCDSIVTLNLTINKTVRSTETIAACKTYTWHGQTFTESNTTSTWTGVSAAGCDSIVTLNLTINKLVTAIETISACKTYTWHGKTYTANNNTATWTGVSSAGCDSMVTLNLTIKKPCTSIEKISACNSYTWHGQTFNGSNNTATWTGVNAAGCDSVVTLNLTILDKAPVVGAINGPSNVCRNQTGVLFSVTPVVGATSYTWALPSGVTGTSASSNIAVSINASFTTGAIQVRANNACGGGAYVQTIITSPTATPGTPAAITGTKGYCIAGNYVYSIAGIPGATNYVWAVTGTGLSIVSGQGSTSLTVANTAAFTAGTISVRATNCLGSSLPIAIVVAISKAPAKPGIISGPATGVCKKTNVVYSVVPVAGATSYTWTVPADATFVSGPGANSITVSFGTIAAGNITVQANNDCGSSSPSSLAVTVLPAQPGLITGSASVFKSQSAVPYSIAVIPDVISYTWTITGGAKFTGSTAGNAVTVNFNTDTWASAGLSVKATNACGSSAATTKIIAVSMGAAPRPAIANKTVVEESQKLSSVNVYPNPGNGQFNVSFTAKKMEKVSISITDMAGLIIYQSANTYQSGDHSNKINISKFAKGTYMLHIGCSEEEEKVIRVLVQ